MPSNDQVFAASPSAMVSGWQDRQDWQLVAVLTSLSVHQHKHALLTLTGTAFLLGLGTFSVLSLESGIGAWHTSIQQSHVLQAAAPTVVVHHERGNSPGYSLGLEGKNIPSEIKLFALVDVFDALTSPRIDQPALGIESTLATMADRWGSHADLALFDRFIEHAPDFTQGLLRDKNVLITRRMERLTPYVELLAPERVTPKVNNTRAGRATGTKRVAQGTVKVPTPMTNQSTPTLVEEP